MKKRTITVKGTEVAIVTRHEQDYISLTDMVKGFEGGNALIENDIRAKDTIFPGAWEQVYNRGFNSLEFEGIMGEAGLNRFSLTPGKWVEDTPEIGLFSKACHALP